jgi:chromosome segregation ATPase
MSKDPVLAMKEAKTLMDRLSKTLGEEENATVLDDVCGWLEHWNAPSSSAALTEANVEARDFRLDFAQETLQSFKRDRSRSPRRSDDWDAKAAALLSDIANSRIDNHKGHIQSLQATIQAKDACIASLEERIEKARIDDVIKKANIDALGDVVKAKDDRIASLEWRLALKERTTEMLHEIISEHCRRAASR